MERKWKIDWNFLLFGRVIRVEKWKEKKKKSEIIIFYLGSPILIFSKREEVEEKMSYIGDLITNPFSLLKTIQYKDIIGI
jgi:hypothetical protein